MAEPTERPAPDGALSEPQRPSWRMVAAAAGTTVVLTAGVAAAFAGTMDSSVTPPPPPGARDAAGAVDTVPAVDPPSGTITEPAEPAALADEAEDNGEDEEPEPEPETEEEPDAEPSPSAEAEQDPQVSPEWLDRVSEETGIPPRALEGYAMAQLRLADEDPGCQISWPTLAGIGWVESHHGTYAGGEIGPDGNTTVDVIGVPLNGGPGLARIPDTNNGELDGDTEWDRAVGPMQFIPTTWDNWGADADGSGEADPHNIDDAALSSARYLCAGGRDLTTGEDWWQAILSYNSSTDYGHEVLDTANSYATATSD